MRRRRYLAALVEPGQPGSTVVINYMKNTRSVLGWLLLRMVVAAAPSIHHLDIGPRNNLALSSPADYPNIVLE